MNINKKICGYRVILLATDKKPTTISRIKEALQLINKLNKKQ